jgi:ferredoxin/nitrate reductase gamma subunit
MTATVAVSGPAAVRVDQTFLPELRRYGAFDVDACFNCGNCTAVCPLTEGSDAFPRRIIRYAQLGMRDELLSSRELWLCYGCSQCSETCPRQAEPGEFMAAARRYAIARYDRSGLARLLFTVPAGGALVAIVLAAVFALFMASVRGPMPGQRLAFFDWIPASFIHDLGLAVLAAVAVAGAAGVAAMLVRLAGRRPGRADLARPAAVGRALWSALAVESLGQQRYRTECETATPEVPAVAWYQRRWFVHATIMWGFLGLLAATILDYGLEITGIKPTGTAVPIWYPVRLLGTVAGVLLLYGTTVAIGRRVRRSDRYARRSQPSDWLLLALLWTSGATGFAIETALYLPDPPAWGYWVFLVHVAVAMELVLLAPFTKFAHALYRPLALLWRALDRSP